jgi:hypothetical protein
MRITRSVFAAAAVALAVAAPAVAGRPGFAMHGWVVPAQTTVRSTATAGRPLTLAQLPLLTTYAWAQPGTAVRHIPHAEPWSL